MKVTAILGSPNKKGTTSTIAGTFLAEAEKRGAKTNTYFLNEMNFKGCQGCHACKSVQDHCVLKDDLIDALEDMKTSDMMVFATPVYYGDVTGQFKCFIDRTWSLVKPDYETNPEPSYIPKGKRALFITSQQAGEELHKDVVNKYLGFLTMYGFKTDSIRACGIGAQNPNAVDEYIVEAKKIANRILPKA
jgi:multimeric flavodoxin WrbA